MDIDFNIKNAINNLNIRLKKIENYLNNLYKAKLCDNCGNKIYNLKFKCMTCDYSVCKNCESNLHNIHNNTHIYMRITINK